MPGVHAGLGLRGAGDHPPIRSLYIHTPFCAHKCHYCDFYSFVDQRDQQAAFIERLERELTALAPHAGPLRTIFVGGGTPSLLRVDLWERLLWVLHDRFDMGAFAPGCVEPGEFTVECNPESTTGELCGLLLSRGVNRVSIGAQSFNPRHLKTLERWHDPENVARAVTLAREAGIARQSVDLIFAIPGQTLEEWDADLDRALALKTTHLSCYNLTYEPNTAMTKRLERAEFTPVDDEVEAAMFAHTRRRLAAAGLRAYEISNFALPGHESRHNLAYWRQDQWLAAGPSASGHIYADSSGWARGSWRFKNVPRLGDYLASDAGAGFSPVVDLEPPEPLRLIRERLMMGLRLGEGIDGEGVVNDAEAMTAQGGESLRRVGDRLVHEGLMVIDANGRWTLTENGFAVGDSVAAELMNAVRSPVARARDG